MKVSKSIRIVIMIALILAICITPNHVFAVKDFINNYGAIDNSELVFHLSDVVVRKEQLDNGIMTPLDGEFSALVCRTADNQNTKKIDTINNKIINGIILTEKFGEISIRYKQGKPLFLMHEFQFDILRDFLNDRLRESDLQKRMELNSAGADITLIQNIIYCVVRAISAHNRKPIPDLDTEASVAVYSISTFGYKPGDKMDANILAAFNEARRLTIRCFEEGWINNEYKITNPTRTLYRFNSAFTKTGLTAFSKIEK